MWLFRHSDLPQGTGLFLGSGKTIAKAGPAGALLAYTFMGLATAGVSVRTLILDVETLKYHDADDL